MWGQFALANATPNYGGLVPPDPMIKSFSRNSRKSNNVTFQEQ